MLTRYGCLFLFCLLCTPTLADGPYRTVVLQESPVVGDPTATYSRFSPGYLDKFGNAIYYASKTGGTGGFHGIWSEAGGSLSLVYEHEAAAPGTTAATEFDFMRSHTANRLGAVAITADLDGPYPLVNSQNDSGLWSNTSGAAVLVAREGSTAPGPVGALFDSFSTFAKPVLNSDGTLAFLADMKNGAGGVTFSDQRGIWRGTDSTDLELVARKNSQVAGATLGLLHGGLRTPMINELGELAFQDYLTGTGITVANASVLWGEVGSTLTVMAQQGDLAPVPGASGEVLGGSFNDYRRNNNGTVLFRNDLLIGAGAVLAENNSTLWTGAPGSLDLVARENSQAPGTPVGALFRHLNSGVLNAADHVAFSGLLHTGAGGVTSENDRGIWSNGSGSMDLIARSAAVAPGTSGALFQYFSPAGLNDAGQVTFHATLKIGTAGVDITNHSGIWAQLPDGTLTLVARTGNAIDVDDGPAVDLRTLTAINWTGNTSGLSNETGQSQYFNEEGKVLFNGHFEGSAGGYGDQGVFIWDSSLAEVVPEPSSLVLGTLGLLAFVSRRKRQA